MPLIYNVVAAIVLCYNRGSLITRFVSGNDRVKPALEWFAICSSKLAANRHGIASLYGFHRPEITENYIVIFLQLCLKKEESDLFKFLFIVFQNIGS